MDFLILDFIQEHLRCDFLDATLTFITRFGDGGIFWIICSLLMLLIPKTRRVGAAMIAGLALEALCCNVLLKPLVARIRPYDVNLSMQLLISPPIDFSFPSGHAGASFAIVSALFFSRNRLWIPAFVLSLLICFSRLYLYVHYPTDVFSGIIVGIVTGWLGSMLAARLCEYFVKKNET